MNDQRPLVQWSFLQYKKISKDSVSPVQVFQHSATQIGSKILVYGGCDYYGEAKTQLFLYDASNYQWSRPEDAIDFQEDHPGGRYGHTCTLLEMHPPKLLLYGGMVGGSSFEFAAPDSVDSNGIGSGLERTFMNWRRKGKKAQFMEEMDDAVYFLTLNADRWIWTKPLVQGDKSMKPASRAEHSACKTGTNEVTIFGGWASRPMNDMWTFNYVDMEWRQVIAQGIQPRPRYRHTCEIIGNKLYIFGGSDNGDDIAEKSRYLGVHMLSLDTMQWSHPVIKGYNPFPRSGHNTAVIGAQTVAIFGGKVNGQLYLNDLVLLNLETMETTVVNAVASYLPTPIVNASLSVIGNSCIVFGGTDAKGQCYNDIRTVDVGYYLNSSDISVREGATSNYSFKLIIIGDASVGKSALLSRFSENEFPTNSSSTIGIDFNSRMIRVDRAICKLEIWDTAGQERFSTITANYYRGAQGALLVFDVCDRDSFTHVINWYNRAKQLGGEDLECLLIGNKSDLSQDLRQVSSSEAEEFASTLSIPYVETSALSGTNVENAFVCMTSNIKKSVDRRGLNGIKGINLRSSGGVQLAKGERSFFRFCGFF